MVSLQTCQKCRGFVPPSSAECVHCGATLASVSRGSVRFVGLLGLAGAGLSALTLMACYGMPPCEDVKPGGNANPYSCYDMEPDGGDTLPPDGGQDAGQ